HRLTDAEWHAVRARRVPRLRHADGCVVVPAVEVPAHLDDHFFTRKSSGEAQGHERGLGAGSDELDLAAATRTGHYLLDEFAPLDFQRVAGAVVAALLHLLSDCRGD